MYIIVDDVTEEKFSPNASEGYCHIGLCAVLKIMLSIFVKLRKSLFGDLASRGLARNTESHTQGQSWGQQQLLEGYEWRSLEDASIGAAKGMHSSSVVIEPCCTFSHIFAEFQIFI